MRAVDQSQRIRLELIEGTRYKRGLNLILKVNYFPLSTEIVTGVHKMLCPAARSTGVSNNVTFETVNEGVRVTGTGLCVLFMEYVWSRPETGRNEMSQVYSM